MRMSQIELDGIQIDLSRQDKQSFGRGDVWRLMRHIEAQEAELERAAKSVDFLQDCVVKQAMKLQRRRKKPTLWERIFRR